MPAEVLTNLESLGELFGTLKGLATGLNDDVYMETIIKQAHGKAANAFDLAAAATASAGHLKHVFEYGTAGITPGPPKFADPTAPEARLWVHTLHGHGGSQDIGYSFRPAVNRNPQPTTASTGVPSKYLRKLSRRKYVFWNKAFVMESGQSVEIHAKNGEYLFIPFGKEGSRNPQNTRNFVMWNSKKKGPITAVPGQQTKGTFTAFWSRWWGGPGADIMETDMRKTMDMDVAKAMEAAAKRAAAHKVETVASTNVPGAVNKAWVFTKSIFASKTYRKVTR